MTVTTGGKAEEIVKAEEPSAEFRSLWTDLRGVSFEQGFLDVGGRRIRYLRSGSKGAPKLMMLPGTGGHAETFVANLGPLGQHFECWAIDVPGSGYSDKTGDYFDAIHTAHFVKAMADSLGFSSMSVMGCSMGSWVALQLTHLYPELVKRLILISPAGGPMPEEGDPWFGLWHMDDIAGDAGRARLESAKKPTWEVSEKVLRALTPDPRRLPDDMIASRFDVNRQPGAADVVEKVNWWFDKNQRIANTLTRDDLRKINKPVLGVTEINDQNLKMIRAMFEEMPNGHLVRMEGVGHWPHYEAPKRFNEIALQFLTGR